MRGYQLQQVASEVEYYEGPGRRSLFETPHDRSSILLDDMVLSGRTFIKAWNLCITYNIAVPVLYYQNYTFLVLYTVHPQDNWDRRERRRAGVISIGCLTNLNSII